MRVASGGFLSGLGIGRDSELLRLHLTGTIALLIGCGFGLHLPAYSQDLDRTLLLVDDRHILYRSGTERFLHPTTRNRSNPVIAETRPWEVAIAWTTVHYDPSTKQYQVWYQAYGGPGAPQPQCVTCYATSEDGVHWSKPELDLFSYGQVERTNIVMVGNGGHSLRYGNGVVVDPRDPDPAKRYKMAYFDFSVGRAKSMPGLFVAFSSDGIHWKRPDIRMPLMPTAYGDYEDPLPLRNEPGREWAVPLSIADAHDIYYDTTRETFVDVAKMWIDGPDGKMFWKHGIGRSESKDFIHWSKPELILTPDEHDPPHVEFHTAPVFQYAGYHFCLAQILNRAENGGVMDIELMISHDGLNWNRPFRDTFFFSREGAQNFERGSIFTNSTPVVLEDQIRFYYGAYSLGATGADDTQQESGIGFFTIPRDRFAGLRPVAISNQATLRTPRHNIGQVTMKPLSLDGIQSIKLNADAAGGQIHLELLDADGYRVAGFTREDAVPIKGDALRHRVGWQERTLADLPAGQYMLRIHLDQASLFAVELYAE